MEKDFFSLYNEIAEKTDFSKANPDNNNNSDLPEGYYLSELEAFKLGLSSTNKPMVTLQFKVIEGYPIDKETETHDFSAPKFINKKIWLYFVVDDSKKQLSFADNMLKFEDENGEAIIDKEIFMDASLLNDALEILLGARIYICITESKNKDNEKIYWKNMLSWKRVRALELPE